MSRLKTCTRASALFFAIALCGTVAPSLSAGEDGLRPFTLVLDPGHGGKDYGCTGRSAKEKTIVLDVATRLGRMIDKRYADSVDVVYTRKDDSFISLQDRAAKANEAGGDLFISIHVNSLDRRNRNRAKIHGASVYTVGLHKSESNLEVAMRENAVIELEGEDAEEIYQGFDPNSTESYTIFELSQSAHLQNSLEMASLAQEALVDHAGRADKGIRQAGFWVLWATGMPSVLVELDFICNPDAEKFLNTASGRQKCAEALFEAFGKYFGRHSEIRRHSNQKY